MCKTVSLLVCFKQKTAYEVRISDWSTAVCSSDRGGRAQAVRDQRLRPRPAAAACAARHAASTLGQDRQLELDGRTADVPGRRLLRSDERRVGKECVSTCRSRWAPDHTKNKDPNGDSDTRS